MPCHAIPPYCVVEIDSDDEEGFGKSVLCKKCSEMDTIDIEPMKPVSSDGDTEEKAAGVPKVAHGKIILNVSKLV